MVEISYWERFWKLPVSRQLATAAFIVVIAESTAIMWQEKRHTDYIDATAEKIERMQEKCDSEKTELRIGAISELKGQLADMKNQLAAKNQLIDDANETMQDALQAQRRAKKNMKKTLQVLNK